MCRLRRRLGLVLCLLLLVESDVLLDLGLYLCLHLKVLLSKFVLLDLLKKGRLLRELLDETLLLLEELL